MPVLGSAGWSRWRRPKLHGRWRSDEMWNRGTGGDRQKVTLARRRRRRHECKFARPRRQEEQRRRRRRRVARPVEHHDRLVDKKHFVGRRRRHAEIVIGEIRRRLECRGQYRQAAPRIPLVRPVRITAQIRPISFRRIGDRAAAPDDFLAAHRQHPGDASGVRTVRIDGEELLVAIDTVAVERRRVGIVDARKVADRSGAHIGNRHDVRRRRRVGRPFGQEEWTVDL
jgi:hypothetical protein